MIELCFSVLDNFKEYIGDGWLVWIIFCVAVIISFFLFINERKKIFTIAVLSLIIVFNPMIYLLIGEKFLSGVYWRLFWIIPMILVIAWVGAELISRMKNKLGKAVVLAVFFLIIMKSQTCIFNGDTYSVPTNQYQLPQQAIDVSDTILELSGGYGAKIAVPDNLSSYIRQYTSKITLVYGRNVWGYITDIEEAPLDFYKLLHEENLDLQKIHDMGIYLECRYIVFDLSNRELPDKKTMENYGIRYETTVDNYAVYALE